MRNTAAHRVADAKAGGGETMVSTRAIDEVLFTWPADEPRLIGGECTACGAVAFPRPPSCARCTSESVVERLLARRGVLWSYTVQRFRPKEPYVGPEPFEPYGVGYVELPDGVIVEARLTVSDPAALEVGHPMELVIEPFAVVDGTQTVTFAFAPAADIEEVRP